MHGRWRCDGMHMQRRFVQLSCSKASGGIYCYHVDHSGTFRFIMMMCAFVIKPCPNVINSVTRTFAEAAEEAAQQKQ